MATSSSKARSSPYSSTSSASSRLVPRPSSSYGSRSMTPSNVKRSDYSRGRSGTPVSYPSMEEQMETVSRSGDSIRVTVRFRPLSGREYQRGDEIAWYPDGDKIVRNEYNPATAYAFDRVFGPDTSTPDVYEVAARPVVKAAMEGVNGTVFAYGVTSSGKTHTMHGDQNCPGIIPLAIKDVFNIIQETPGREYLLRVSYLEIYNEVINDLLDPTGQNLRVREDAQGTYVEGIKEEVVLSPGHALSFIAAGEEHRHVGSNNFNLFSSRSHTIFTLMIESSDHGDEYGGVIFSQLNLIDLAGSESSKTETTGIRRKEGSYINKSLLTLGTVIGKLSEGKASHVPYRDSKLTRLLQSSLSGQGHVSLICTITPASSNMEETHNTLKFASRAKRVEIYASRNRIIDEKSLIKKYQREISCLKEELDQLKRGMLVGVKPEELMVLKQQLEEGQSKMQSRLEEEEEAKAALMSRIQRLTKLILVSSKDTLPEYLSSHKRTHSVTNDDKMDVQHDGSRKFDGENPENSTNKWNDDFSQAGSLMIKTNRSGELITSSSELHLDDITMSDQMDLLIEQVKMLAGEIGFGTSTLKRLVEQSASDPESSRSQIENLEHEIQEKREKMRMLEQRIVESGEVSAVNAPMFQMQQTITKLMAQCSEKAFELEIKSADNRVLQEQLQNKCSENEEMQLKIVRLEQQLASASGNNIPLPSEQRLSDEYADDLRKNVKSQDVDNEKLEHILIVGENAELHVQNQKLAEEASYAKELASAAAVELKNLAAEVTKLSLQNAKLEKELQGTRLLSSKSSSIHAGNRKLNDAHRTNRRGRLSGRSNNIATESDDFESGSLDTDDMRLELQAWKQREAALEAALAEKEAVEHEYRKKYVEAKKKEADLENDLANMWVLVAQLKKEGAVLQESKLNDRHNEDMDQKSEVIDDIDCKDLRHDYGQAQENPTLLNIPRVESLVVRLKARMQEMREKERRDGNGDANSHSCKVCFESATTAMLLPCRHFCLCKSCSLACSECPICRTKIADRIFVFT